MARTREEVLMAGLVGHGARKGDSWFGRGGDVMQHPPAWAGVAALLAVAGPRGRRAALRGAVAYVAAALAHLPIKRLVGRRHPRRAHRLQPVGPVASSFPSGHAASDLAFAFGVAQELPWLFGPLSTATLAVHWTLVRKRAHYPSDVIAGGLLGIAVAAAMGWLWPAARKAAPGDLRQPIGEPLP